MRLVARRDSNEDELIACVKQVGGKWLFSGPLDGWCGLRGKWYPVEIKTPKGRYTPLQRLFLADCELQKLPVWTWRSIDDVIRCVNSA